MTGRPEELAEVALLEVHAVERQAGEFRQVAEAQRSAIAQYVEDLRRSAAIAVGLAAEFERRLADLADYAERLADRQARLARLAAVRGGVRLEGTADGGVVVVVYEAAAENAAIVRTVAFTPQEVMLSVSPPPLLGVEPAVPQPEVEPGPPEVAPSEPVAPPPAVEATVPPPQLEVVPAECATPAVPKPRALVGFLSRLAGWAGMWKALGPKVKQDGN